MFDLEEVMESNQNSWVRFITTKIQCFFRKWLSNCEVPLTLGNILSFCLIESVGCGLIVMHTKFLLASWTSPGF